jgi:hypothetical protein
MGGLCRDRGAICNLQDAKARVLSDKGAPTLFQENNGKKQHGQELGVSWQGKNSDPLQP